MQCVMVPEGRRVALSHAETLVRFLMTLTVSFPGYPLDVLQNGYFPKVMIVFTAISRYDHENAPVGKKAKGSKSNQTKRSAKQTFENLIKEYRKTIAVLFEREHFDLKTKE